MTKKYPTTDDQSPIEIVAPPEAIIEADPEIIEPDPVPECPMPPTKPAFRLGGIAVGSKIQIINKPDWVQGQSPFTVVSSHCVISSDGIKTVNSLLSNYFASIL
jgi:hypothetical protein